MKTNLLRTMLQNARPCRKAGSNPRHSTTQASLHGRCTVADPASIMAPFFANRSCDPFLPKAAQCVVGTYNAYTVNVSEYHHVAKTIRFATRHNVRLTIRNTGHELVIWASSSEKSVTHDCIVTTASPLVPAHSPSGHTT